MAGEPLNLCQPDDDSYDWGPCYDWNFSVIRSTLNALALNGNFTYGVKTATLTVTSWSHLNDIWTDPGTTPCFGCTFLGPRANTGLFLVNQLAIFGPAAVDSNQVGAAVDVSGPIQLLEGNQEGDSLRLLGFGDSGDASVTVGTLSSPNGADGHGFWSHPSATTFGITSVGEMAHIGPSGLSVTYGVSAATGTFTGALTAGSISGTVTPGSVDFSTITTALAGKLSNTAPVPNGLIDLSTVTTALAGKLSNTAAVPTALLDFSTITTALAGKLSNTAAVPNGLIDLSTVTTALAGKLSSSAAVPNGLIDLSTVTTAFSGKADDNAVVHLAGSENISGAKTFQASGSSIYSLTTSSGINIQGGILNVSGGVGSGVSAPYVTGDTVTAKNFVEKINAIGNSGTSLTVDWSVATISSMTLTGNVTLAFSHPLPGQTMTFIFKQDATGGRTVTWPAGLKWPSGTAPSITGTAGKVDIISVVYTGNDYFGFTGGQNY